MSRFVLLLPPDHIYGGLMSSKWLSPFVYSKTTQGNSFDKFHSKNTQEYHLYSPWDHKGSPELLFQIKKKIQDIGSCEINLGSICSSKIDISSERIISIQTQLSSGIETHLVLSNLESIHLYRVCDVKFKGSDLSLFVDDVFVLSAHEEVESKQIEGELESFIESEFKERVFFREFRQENEKENFAHEFKWSKRKRNVTYEYYIESKELKENIYNEGWGLLTKSTQHELISSGLNYHQSLFLPHKEKWEKLAESFAGFKAGIYFELNDLYIDKLCMTINSSQPLNEAWEKFKELHPSAAFVKNLNKLLTGEVELIDNFKSFNEYVDGIKNFFFFLKQYFAKNLVNEESLFIESFISNHEQLVEPYRLSEVRELLAIYNEIDSWIQSVQSCVDETSNGSLRRECNLKLSGLVRSLSSTDIEQNIILKLLREKSSSHVPKQTLAVQVKSLLNIDVKKVA